MIKVRWFLGLLGIAVLLRFLSLALKPLWLDEVYTALLSLGQGFASVPRQVVFPVSAIEAIFSLKPQTCPQIAHLVATEDVHPPLFFCGLHTWLKMTAGLDLPLVWSLRAFPALLGVIQVATLYGLNRAAFSPTAGWLGAALMAVSPFHVYLSQEARHYTAPMLWVILALFGLIHIVQHLNRQKIQPWIWLFWIITNGIGLYTHYFFLLAVVAQVATLLVWMIGHRSRLQSRHWITAGLATVALLISYLPWLPTLLEHMGRPETSWLTLSRKTWLDYIPPLYQKLAGWIVMVVALPIEQQSVWVMLPMGLVMVIFFGWLVRESYGGLRHLRSNEETRSSTQLLFYFIVFSLLQFVIIIYIVGKDLSLAPRYNFVYYPAVCALLGASLATPSHWQRGPVYSRYVASAFLPNNLQFRQWFPLVVGGISCLFIIFNLAFLTPYDSRKLVDEIIPSSTPPILLMPYRGDTEIALGLSIMWEIHNRDELRRISVDWAFFQQPNMDHETSLEQALPRMTVSRPEPFEMWLLGFRWHPNMFPPSLHLSSQTQTPFLCQTTPNAFSSATLSHQRYTCHSDDATAPQGVPIAGN